MIDSGSSDTFIDEAHSKKLNLVIFPKERTIPLADKKHVAKVVGEVIVDIEVNGVEHVKVAVEVIKNLCTDIIIEAFRLSNKSSCTHLGVIWGSSPFLCNFSFFLTFSGYSFIVLIGSSGLTGCHCIETEE